MAADDGQHVDPHDVLAGGEALRHPGRVEDAVGAVVGRQHGALEGPGYEVGGGGEGDLGGGAGEEGEGEGEGMGLRL